ncbi:hypothetical protein FRACYDRAFT_230826 [Fragilariopsis cylindrus CCMP1102]|uniref:MYND-type domain-containing protein n=1 Tax=Fragilariopsis cylindrus CCMP1102 TaxID=635003 RepID=A0A1E7EK45_9STRA|nr:hypothetical protein FRACYDRAFT_230826 [Fragilariopsis cylindrus CCMP1102]|eukprot:OEU06248.1 hypothetical protein FRACYDRAFT_230826 [Fragilariopsis cylindrus CCMP1102]
MGRKQKLRQEKKHIKNKAATTAEVTAAAAAAAAVATTFLNEDAIAETAEEKMLAVRVRQIERALALDNQLPRSDTHVQAMADTDNISYGEQWELFEQGVTEDECVHSMQGMGDIYMNTTEEKRIHLALPWYLEGAIRGSVQSTISLMGTFYIRSNRALYCYWGKITKKYYGGVALVDRMKFKELKDLVERECVICSKTDTSTFTLQQCKGCSVYCYCDEGCQTIHWEERKHRNECKQVHILNKYHKPYAKEIRDAVIRGDKEIPSLEKLRYKLGLTRPRKEYIEFHEPTSTHNGKIINPDDYLVAREDGTVWVGSTPRSPIRTS